MGNCLGRSDVLKQFETGKIAYYALRDPSGKSVASLSIRSFNGRPDLYELRGILNQPLDLKTQHYAIEFLERYNIDVGADRDPLSTMRTGLIRIGNRIISASALPAGYRSAGDLVLKGLRDVTLPPNLYVNGTLDIRDTDVQKLGANTTIKVDLLAGNTPLSVYPVEARIGRSVMLNKTDVRVVPAGTVIEGSLSLIDTPTDSLPVITVKKDLLLRGSEVTLDRMDPAMRVFGDVYYKKDVFPGHRLRAKIQGFIRSMPKDERPLLDTRGVYIPADPIADLVIPQMTSPSAVTSASPGESLTPGPTPAIDPRTGEPITPRFDTTTGRPIEGQGNGPKRLPPRGGR